MRRFTYQSKAHDLTHSELISAAREAAGVGNWEVESVDWYDGGSTTTFATVHLVTHDRPVEVEG